MCTVASHTPTYHLLYAIIHFSITNSITYYKYFIHIQWGKKVFSQPPIVQVLPLKKMREACNFHHRYTLAMRDKIRKEKSRKSHCRIFKDFICKLWWKISIWSPTNKQDCWCHESGCHSLQLHITHGLHLPSCTAHTHSRPPLHQSHSCHHSLINPDCLTTPAPHSLTHIKAAHKHSPSAKSCFSPG